MLTFPKAYADRVQRLRVPAGFLLAAAFAWLAAPATESLAALSHETQALLGRDLYRAVRAYAQSAIKPRTSQHLATLESAGRQLDEAAAASADGPAEGAPEDKKVEIF